MERRSRQSERGVNSDKQVNRSLKITSGGTEGGGHDGERKAKLQLKVRDD